ncbi:ABC transporter ATP-binding protein/permease [Microbacteriaceae bacterium VKM Ac-2855]|nr:ABC transporter ATP-binding protein/permease [Microbacteriaceae bacterium VKM Ac-2855]
MTALLELRGIGRRYGTGSTSTVALRRVDLTIERGEFVAIIGPSGAGKSTLLNVLGLLDTPSEGTYRIDGADTTTLKERHRDRLRSQTFGFVFQSSHVLPDDSVARNAAVGLRIQGEGLRIQRSRVAEVLEFLGLTHRAGAAGRSLSGGEKQRLAIARAISTNPSVVLADEPTGNLDTANSDDVVGLLRRLHADGATVIVITHDERVASAATRRVTMVDGSVHAEAPLAAPGGSVPHRSRPRAGDRTRALVSTIGDALSAITLRPGRTFFLLLAFLVGTGGLVAATGLGETAAAQISQRLAQAALDQVTVTLPTVIDPGERVGAEQVALDRINALDHVTGSGRAIMVASADADLALLPPGSVEVTGEISVQVYGGDDDYLRLQNVTTSPSSAAGLFDASVPGRFALLGDAAASDLGIGRTGPGTQVWIDGEPVDIIGTFESTGRAPELDGAVYVSHGVTDTIAGSIRTIVARTDLGYPAPVAEAIPSAVDPGSPGSVSVDTIADLRHLRRGVAGDLGQLIGAISWVLLGLATISAAAILFVSANSRISEIGLRRALGASRISTTGMFLLEGLFVGFAGGLAGVAAGLSTILMISASQHWIAVLSPGTIAVGLAAGAVTGLLASVAPALRSGYIDPAQAVRA